MHAPGWGPFNAKWTRRGVKLALIIVPPLAYFSACDCPQGVNLWRPFCC
jgi:hypothetical protein